MTQKTFLQRLGKGLAAITASTLLAFSLAGCQADGNGLGGGGIGGGGGGGGGSGNGPTDLENCTVVVATLCVLGGDEHGNGLVDVLLDPNGPLGPIAGSLDIDALTDALETLLENDGDLVGLLTNLLQEGQLQEGLQALLLPDENGDGGLANIVQNLLMGSEEGRGLLALLQDDVPGLLQALLLDGSDASCQAPLGTLCLVAGPDSNQTGLVDLLLTTDGALGAISPYLTDEVTNEIVAWIGDLAESDGSLGNLVQNLLAEGQLQDALQALLLGNPDENEPSGLISLLEDTLGGITGAGIFEDLADLVGNLLGINSRDEERTPIDTTNCTVVVSTLCVLGDEEHGNGLADVLLDPTGPLGPIAAALDTEALADALKALLENDGSAVELVTRLIAEGQLQEGLQALLLPDENGDGGLANILQNLLAGTEEGQGLLGLFQNDVPGLLQALLLNGSEADCQAPLGTLCLIAGPDSGQTGLVDLLLVPGGALSSISPYLSEEVTNEVVEWLGNLAESDGSLGNLVQNLLAEGQLAEGLQLLLIGNPEDGTQSGLLSLLEDTVGGLDSVIEDVGQFLGNLLGGLGGGLGGR